MSKFSYNVEGELNSQYLLDLLKEYLSQLLLSNDTNGIVEDEYKINPNANGFVQWFRDFTKRLFKSKASLDNYNKVLSTKYINSILDKIDIFLQTNVLQPNQFLELKQTLKAIHFDITLPQLDEYRERAIKSSQKRFLKVINDIKYLKNAKSNYILYNSPVSDLKPFLSDRVSIHTINYIELQKLVKQFIHLRYIELTTYENTSFDIKFIAKNEDFYKDNITDNGIGEEVEGFIRLKMLEKLEILKQDELLPEELQNQVSKIDILLKRLKIGKIEKMMQELIKLKTNLAHAKEVMDKCKDIINGTTIPNKAQIFLTMDNLYYNLSKKCETLQQKTKLKLQLVDKTKMFASLQSLQNNNKHSNSDEDKENNINTLPKPNKSSLHTHKMQNNETFEKLNDNNVNNFQNETKSNIASNLYDDDELGEIHISEDDDSDAEAEIIIDEDK